MKKFKLSLEELKVESFQIQEAKKRNGTIIGQELIETQELNSWNTEGHGCDTAPIQCPPQTKHQFICTIPTGGAYTCEWCTTEDWMTNCQ